MCVLPDGSLGEFPIYLTPLEWGTLRVHGEEMIPGTSYAVRAKTGAGALSELSTATTWAWGDANGDGTANVTDTLLIVSGFQGDFSGAPLEVVDMMPCEPDGVIGLADVMAPILAFQGVQYLDTTCAAPCP
jgi:hypothetical protein